MGLDRVGRRNSIWHFAVPPNTTDRLDLLFRDWNPVGLRIFWTSAPT